MSRRNYKPRFLILAFVLAIFSNISNVALAADAVNSPPPAVPRVASVESSNATGTFSQRGAATCLQCHNEEPIIDILNTPHAMKSDQRTPFGQHECESCHGPSDAHATGFSKGAPASPAVVFKGPNASPVSVRNQVCLSCHEDSEHINWQGSQHQRKDLACVSCHTVHVNKDPVLVKISQPEVCFSCHAQQRAESSEYSHHPIQEGKVVCSDCHNPHGSAGPHLLKEFTVNETCYNCHAEKRGPMLWEHQPVRENCLNCHTPHGSNEARLLKERMNFMCSSCHSAVSNSSGGAFGGLHSLPGNLEGTATFNSALANNRMCLNCHSEIHGSNSPNGAFFFR